MGDYRITCTQKSSPYTPISGITAYGNHLEGWVRSREQIVSNKRNGDSYHTHEGGFRAETVIEGVFPNEYLRTVADPTPANNLGNLPPCPPGLSR